MRQALVLTILMLISSPTVASGFGWYLYAFEWERADEDLTAYLAEYNSLLAVAPSSVELREHFQSDIDSAVLSLCQGDDMPNNFEAFTEGFSPADDEFFSVRTIQYGQITQVRRGKSDSLFGKFVLPSTQYVVGPGLPTNSSDPYVIFAPNDVAKFHAELAELNRNVKHPAEMNQQLKELEAGLQFALKHEYSRKIPDSKGFGVIFCGHD